MTTDQLHIRNMTRAELDVIVDWAANEGWNPGLHDADIFWTTDPDAFIAAEFNGEMIGGGSIVNYSGVCGFMGFFIVHPGFRGRNFGHQLWIARRDCLIKRLHAPARIEMDGVFNMQSFYTKGGFQFLHRDLRFQIVESARDNTATTPLAMVSDSTLMNSAISDSQAFLIHQHNSGNSVPSESDFTDVNIVDLSTIAFEKINQFDQAIFMAPRSQFLQRWISQPACHALGAMRNGNLSGYAVARPCRTGYKIGPLFANDPETAHILFQSLLARLPHQQVQIDVPECNTFGVEMVKRCGFTEVFGCARMAFGPPLPRPLQNIFGVTTFELG